MATPIHSATAVGTGPRCGVGKKALYQGTVIGTGAVSASFYIEATNDNLGWFRIWDKSSTPVAGTNLATDFWNDPGSWDSVRVVVTAITAGARLIVTAVPTP